MKTDGNEGWWEGIHATRNSTHGDSTHKISESIDLLTRDKDWVRAWRQHGGKDGSDGVEYLVWSGPITVSARVLVSSFLPGCQFLFLFSFVRFARSLAVRCDVDHHLVSFLLSVRAFLRPVFDPSPTIAPTVS